jgi:alpha-D-ribose 1-methylphosphonate 5-triphosphate synthase subunit PhnG
MAILARARTDDIERLLAATPGLPAHRRLRGPETGLVMARGRAGGTGAAFNLGEMTVTRCTVRAATGQIGHATIAGRNAALAELAARLDAALQDPALHDALQHGVITALETAQLAARAVASRRAAATRVQFFTMTTMRS